MIHYKLDSKTHAVEPCSFLESAAQENRVDETFIGTVHVSTIFLGLAHGLDSNDRPILFETMILGGSADGHQVRSCTWDEAVLAHAEAVVIAKTHENATRMTTLLKDLS